MMVRREQKKIKASLTTIVLVILAVVFLWEFPIILIPALAGLSFVKHRWAPQKKELLIYVVSAVVGTGSESIMMYTGAWSYADPTFINFPIWLPFLWGFAGIALLTLFQGVSEGE